MTGNIDYFGDISLGATGFVTFGDGARGQIKGLENLLVQSLLNLTLSCL